MASRSLRSWLYLGARLLGDAQAARRGRLPQRLARKAAYRATNRATARALRKAGL